MNKEVRGGGPCAHAHESVYILFILICYACAPRQMQMVRKWAWKRIYKSFSAIFLRTGPQTFALPRLNASTFLRNKTLFICLLAFYYGVFCHYSM